ncbi:ankyrin repeat-containing domain protein [Hypoxylon rubiginosum]|uniref:Ankyrin repeat-containing domain protein n=1 Tax=Hypoxylon rubiginosum TaxID=110542 RepID=A0ACC0CM21_9PEZI|nr:ankyrin repeat-containing domain protein [Hypoxylon rubiginosum]
MALNTAAPSLASLASLMESLTCQESEAQVKKSTIYVPREVVLEICKYLSQADKFHLALTSTNFTIPAIAALHDQDAREDNTAVFWAVSRNHHEVLSRILEHRPQLVNRHFQEDHLHYHGYLPIRAGKFMTPLCTAIVLRRRDCVKVLLSSGADPNLPDQEPTTGHRIRWSPIQWAVFAIEAGEGFDDLLSLLTKHGANLNVSPMTAPSSDDDDDDNDSVYSSSDYTAEELAPLFTQMNFDHPPGTSYEIAKSTATDFHNDLIDLIKARKSKMRSLLKHGADPNLMEESLCATPIFHVAVALLKYEADFYVKESRIWQNADVEDQYDDIIIPTAMDYMDILIKHGGDATVSCYGTTALHIVIRRLDEYEIVVNYLLKAGININATNTSGRTPLFELMERVTPNFDALRRFIRKGANVNHQDEQGSTPLHILVGSRGSQERLRRTILVLLDCGADASIMDSAGQTAKDLAKARRIRLWPEIIDLLQGAESRAKKKHRRGHGGGRGPNAKTGGEHGGNGAKD